MRETISVISFTMCILISLLLYNVCYIKLNDNRPKFNTKRVIFLSIATILIVLNNYFTNVNFKFLVNSVIITIYFKLFFKDNWKHTIISYIIIFAVGVCFELLIPNILLVLNIINNNMSALYVSYLKIVLSILIYMAEVVIFLIYPINRLLKRINNFFIVSINSLNIIYLLFLTMGILSVLNIINFTNTNSIELIIVLFTIFIVLFLVTISLKTKETILKNSNEKLVEYNDNYSKFLDEYKIYKHNINHKLKAMITYGNKKVNALIEELLEEENHFSIKNNNLHNLPQGVKGIIAEKLYNKDYNVLIDNKIKKDPFSYLSPKAFNSISESIGICLDNAIEASEETENPIILLDLYENEENIYIKIGNNYSNNLDITKLGNKYYSTKNRGSGLGLFSIIRNNLVKEKIDIINDFYYIELQIKKAR